MGATKIAPQMWELSTGGHYISFAITGIGMMATAYQLTRILAKNDIDRVIQVGVAGSYNNVIALGKVLFVVSDCIGDLGAEDHEKFLDVFEIGLVGADEYPFSSKILTNSTKNLNINLPNISAITKNTVSGKDVTITMLKEKYGYEIESMEGAALHYVCLSEKVDFAQVRAVSNYVEPRDKSKWQMKLAIDNLNAWLIEYLGSL